jgi:transcriptional regulator GlxA family with amidase domain
MNTDTKKTALIVIDVQESFRARPFWTEKHTRYCSIWQGLPRRFALQTKQVPNRNFGCVLWGPISNSRHRTRRWLSKVLAPNLLAPNQRNFKLLSVCVGAILAADAGLLAHRQCTTHHEILDELATLSPTSKVLSNRVFFEDGPIISSAGITAGIDLALHLIATQCGAAVASTVAQVMVAFTRRGPLAPSQSPLLKYRDHIHPAVHRVQDAVCANPTLPWTTADMAIVGFVTQRHLLRLFTEKCPCTKLRSVPRSFAQHTLCI